MTLTASLKVKISKSSRTTSSSRLRLAEPTDILKWGQLTADFISWTRARLLHKGLLDFVHVKVILDHWFFFKNSKTFQENWKIWGRSPNGNNSQISDIRCQDPRNYSRGLVQSSFVSDPPPPTLQVGVQPDPILYLAFLYLTPPNSPTQLSSPPYPSFRPQPPPLSNPSSTSPKTTLFWNYDPPVDLLTRQWRYLSY